MHIPLKAVNLSPPICKERANFTEIVKNADFALKSAFLRNFKDFVQTILFTKYVKYYKGIYILCKILKQESVIAYKTNTQTF